MSEQKFQVGDYVKVTESHLRVSKGSIWRIEYYVSAEESEDGEAFYIADSTDGERSGFFLDEDKIEKVTEAIPFTIHATVELEITATVHAKSEEDAVATAKRDYYYLIDNYDEMSGRVVEAFPNGW